MSRRWYPVDERDEHEHDERGGSGLGVLLFAVAIAVLAILGFLSIAQEFQRQACESVAGTSIECEAP